MVILVTKQQGDDFIFKEDNMVDYVLTGKVVLITGTNNPKGIGATTAFSFANQGAKVALVYKKMDLPYNEEKAVGDSFDAYYKALAGDCLDVEQTLKSITKDYIIIEADISDEQQVAMIFDRIETTLGTVNILVNNAASYAENDSIFSTNEKTIKIVYSATVNGTILMSQEFVRRLAKNSELFSDNRSLQDVLLNYGKYQKQIDNNIYGRVINFSTDNAQRMAGELCYGSSKAAVEAMTRSIALEVGFLGITVNCIAPGPTQTGWMNEELISSVLPEIPLGKIGLPQDIADTVLFLASNKASWLSGQVIKVSGAHGL